MQFLVYLTILMVSISTVLLEVHWLTSPPPQPKPAVQAAGAAAPVPKVEGPSTALSPVYPKKPETVAQAAPAQQPASETMTTATTPPRPAVETTGIASRETDIKPVAATVASPSNNRCDIQACSSAYRSFRASDCTYQPFEGARRFCEKPPARQAVREQQPDRRRWTKDIDQGDVSRATVGRRVYDDEDESGADFADDDSDRSVIIHRGSRW